MCLRVYFILFYFFLSSISSQITRREKIEKTNKERKMTPEAHRSSDDDTFDIVRKISTR
jgi:hypothetical protein